MLGFITSYRPSAGSSITEELGACSFDPRQNPNDAAIEHIEGCVETYRMTVPTRLIEMMKEELSRNLFVLPQGGLSVNADGFYMIFYYHKGMSRSDFGAFCKDCRLACLLEHIVHGRITKQRFASIIPFYTDVSVNDLISPDGEIDTKGMAYTPDTVIKLVKYIMYGEIPADCASNEEADIHPPRKTKPNDD